MDEIVKQALAKWPNVPHCYGWLGMDARGDYYMRDDACQHAGPFQSYRTSPRAKGSRVTHEKLLAFIHRNYIHDERGAWFFQNGPQRVYVELESTPYVFRLSSDGTIKSHAETIVQLQMAYLDEDGRLYLDTSGGFGEMHSQDMLLASELLSGAIVKATQVTRNSMPKLFAYIRSPSIAQEASSP
jgi:hypothetical protein